MLAALKQNTKARDYIPTEFIKLIKSTLELQAFEVSKRGTGHGIDDNIKEIIGTFLLTEKVNFEYIDTYREINLILRLNSNTEDQTFIQSQVKEDASRLKYVDPDHPHYKEIVLEALQKTSDASVIEALQHNSQAIVLKKLEITNPDRQVLDNDQIDKLLDLYNKLEQPDQTNTNSP